MKSIIQKFLFLRYILIIIFSFSFFYSCKDDPVRPNSPPTDTSDIYNWQVISYSGKLKGLFVADSNNIFLISPNNKPLFFNGLTIDEINLNDPQFTFITLAGFDKNNVIFGGSSQQPDWEPTIKKWTNGNIETYIIQNDSGYSISDILMDGSNQAWITSSGKNNVYYFNSGTFTKYKLDDSVQESILYKDNLNQLYAFGIYIERRWQNIVKILYSYKFINNSFEILSKDSINYPSVKTEYILKCGTDIFMIAHPSSFDQIYYFNGTAWIYYLTVPENYSISNIGGLSKDYFLFFSGAEKIYIWDGNWHQEDSIKFPSYPSFVSIGNSSIIINNDNVYFTAFANYHYFYESFLIIGKKK
jgi:hypothetical protein